VTFRHGRPIAAYYCLPREAHQKSARTRRVEPGLTIDFTADGQAIGIEITAPVKVSLAALNVPPAMSMTRADVFNSVGRDPHRVPCRGARVDAGAACVRPRRDPRDEQELARAEGRNLRVEELPTPNLQLPRRRLGVGGWELGVVQCYVRFGTTTVAGTSRSAAT